MNKSLVLGAVSFLFVSSLLLPANSMTQAPAPTVTVKNQAQAVDSDVNLDFTLVNATGYDIEAIQVSPASAKNWGDNILEEVVADGDSVDISFHPEATAKKWDLQITWSDGGEQVYWYNLDLSAISKITLKYNEETGKTTAITE
jgi:hypothetical protein